MTNPLDKVTVNAKSAVGGDDAGVDAKGAAGIGNSSTSSIRPVNYHPSVFRYVCRGRLTLDSLRRPYEAGVCRGFQTKLQHVDNWRMSTEDEAIHTFQAMAALNDADHHHSPPTPGIPGSPAQNMGSTQGGDASAHAVQTIYMGNVLVYPSKGTSATPTKEETPKPSRKGSSTKQSNEDIQSPEEWSCYGTTEVDLLVLRPEDSKEERIAAVAPYCAPGVTIRDVSVDDVQDDFFGKDRTSTIRLGFLEILYQSSIENNPSQLSSSGGDKGSAASNKHLGKNATTEETARPSFWTRFSNSSTSIWKQMQVNAKLIADTTQDDFYNRTKKASERIAQEMPRTLDRTTNLMWKVITWDWSFPPDEGSDPGRPQW